MESDIVSDIFFHTGSFLYLRIYIGSHIHLCIYMWGFSVVGRPSNKYHFFNFEPIAPYAPEAHNSILRA